MNSARFQVRTCLGMISLFCFGAAGVPRGEYFDAIASGAAPKNLNQPAQPGDLIVRHGKGILGPGWTLGALKSFHLDDITHVGLLAENGMVYDMNPGKGKDKGRAVVDKVAWDIDPDRFQNPGAYSLLDSDIPIRWQGRQTSLDQLPKSLKAQIRATVIGLAEKDRKKSPVGDFGATNHCGDWVIKLYDEALSTHAITVLRYRGPGAIGRDSRALVDAELRDWFVNNFPSFGSVVDPSKINNKLRKVLPPKKTGTQSFVRSGSGQHVGVEAGPISAAALAPFMIGATQRFGRPLINLDEVLPSSGPSRTTRSRTFTLPQTGRPVGNAEGSLGVDFRMDAQDLSTTVAVALVTKTPIETYLHDYAMCARFHGHVLDDLRPVSLSEATGERPSSDSPWFWFSRIQDDRTQGTEAACHFVVFVNETDRKVTVDSRWIDRHYSPYWRDPPGKQYDYVLNFQVWSSSHTHSLELVNSILAKLKGLGGGWKVEFANSQQPSLPTVFVEAAWMSKGAVHLSVWNRRWVPRFVVFHGTTQAFPNAKDEFFEGWRPIQPGRNLVRLKLERPDNAVVLCEVDGFMDKVFVQANENHAPPWAADKLPAATAKPAGGRPQIKISWPPANARVRVLRDLLDMPADDCRLAINGTVSGAPAGSEIEVSVGTTEWYEQDEPTQRDGLWGTRVYLRGEGAANDHRIRARLVDRDGNEIAKDVVDGIVRIDEGAGGRPNLQPIGIKASQFGNRRGVSTDGQGITIGGGQDGPYASGGSASCRVELPEDASKLKLAIAIWHGMPSQLGKGLHSKRNGGKATISINGVVVHKITCRHRHMFNDYWPEERAELGRELPEIDCQAKGIRGKTLTIKIETSSDTCMDLRTLKIELIRR